MQFRDSFTIYDAGQGGWVSSGRCGGYTWSVPTLGFGAVVTLGLFCAPDACFDPLRLALILSQENFFKVCNPDKIFKK